MKRSNLVFVIILFFLFIGLNVGSKTIVNSNQLTALTLINPSESKLKKLSLHSENREVN
mgnify:CR=1 FL=1